VRSYLKKNCKNRAGGVAQGVGPEFKPQYRKKKRYHFISSDVMSTRKSLKA
jgi:hypothetical protein